MKSLLSLKKDLPVYCSPCSEFLWRSFPDKRSVEGEVNLQIRLGLDILHSFSVYHWTLSLRRRITRLCISRLKIKSAKKILSHQENAWVNRCQEVIKPQCMQSATILQHILSFTYNQEFVHNLIYISISCVHMSTAHWNNHCIHHNITDIWHNYSPLIIR